MKTKNQFKIVKSVSGMWECASAKRFLAIAITGALIAVTFPIVHQITSPALAGGKHNLKTWIQVTNLDTGEPIRQRDTVDAGTPFDVTINTNGVDCAGQFVVSAIGAPGNPPSVLVQIESFIIGPAEGSNSFTADPLNASVLPEGYNNWKISVSCNGAKKRQHDYDFFEFYAASSL